MKFRFSELPRGKPQSFLLPWDNGNLQFLKSFSWYLRHYEVIKYFERDFTVVLSGKKVRSDLKQFFISKYYGPGIFIIITGLIVLLSFYNEIKYELHKQ